MAAPNLALFDEFVLDPLDDIDRDGEPDAGIRPALSYYGCIYAYDLALDIHECPTAITGIDGGVCLYVILINTYTAFSPLGANYTSCYSMV